MDVNNLGVDFDWKLLEVKIYIVTEILSRELLGNLLLATVLAARGHTAIILNQEDAFTLSSGSVSGTTIFHAKSLHYAPERILQHTKLREQGFLITSQDQETFVFHRNLSSRVSERFCEENLSLVERSYVWSDSEADEVCRQFPEHSSKVVVTGSPREDTWRKQFRPIGGTDRDRRLILIVPSVGPANHRMRHWEVLALKKTVLGPGSAPEALDVLMESLIDGLRSQLSLSRIALELADEFHDCDVVIQPKQQEILESWKKSLYAVDKQDGRRKNLSIETSRILEESVHSADVVINAQSTAGIIALLAEVPLISIVPPFTLASKIGLQVGQQDDVVGAVRQALEDPEGFMSGYRASSRRKLGKKLRNPSVKMAAEEIVEDFESLNSAHGSSKLTYRDWLLYLSPGSIRRLVSGIKSLVNLRAPIPAFSEMVTTVSKAQINEVLDRLYTSLGFYPGVRVSVAGRRNIIVRPRRSSSRL